MANKYVQIVYFHNLLNEPYQEHLEVDDRGREVRKVGQFADGKVERVSSVISNDDYPLSDEPIPRFSKLLINDDMSADEISAEFFESVWAAAEFGEEGIRATWKKSSNGNRSVDPWWQLNSESPQ